MIIDLTFNPTINSRRDNVDKIKILWATNLILIGNKSDAEICNIIHLSQERLNFLKKTDFWNQAMAFWHPGWRPSREDSSRKAKKRKAKKRKAKKRKAKTPQHPTKRQKLKAELYESQKGICNGCCIQFSVNDLTFDHIQPKCSGGTDTPENFQLLCYDCNKLKDAMTHTEFIDLLRVISPISAEARYEK